MLTMKFLTALIALTLALPGAQAQREPAPPPQVTSALAPLHRAGPDERQLQSHDHYRNKDGQVVHSPAKFTADQVPSCASSKCRDGSYSFSQRRRGTCSHNGGVGD
jgi:hypothetical protein